uniref:Transmembrane protein 182 n=1 Tax=Scleropages formosus TaxID=113540 RepID=A0A8C9RTS1_SCLFO
MKAGVAALLAGVVGAIGVLCFLVAFGTDYWLLASDDCEGYEHLPRAVNSSLVGLANGVTWPSSSPSLTLHHEGFFWRCAFKGEASIHVVWAVLFTNQPAPKVCIRGYLFPLPVHFGCTVPSPTTPIIPSVPAVFRGFWTMLIVLAIGASLMGGFLLVCAVPFTSAKLYRWAGIFLLTAVCFCVCVCVCVRQTEGKSRLTVSMPAEQQVISREDNGHLTVSHGCPGLHPPRGACTLALHIGFHCMAHKLTLGVCLHMWKFQFGLSDCITMLHE